MKPYLHLAICAFQRAVAYPFETWSMLANNLIKLTLFISIWSLLLRADPATRTATLAYVTAIYFMDSINFAHFMWNLPYEIRNGNIALWLLKPLSQPLRLMWEQWGENIVYISQAVPIYLVAWTLLPVPWPAPDRLLLFLVSAVMANLVYMQAILAVATVSFWTLRTNGTVWIMYVGWMVLSGKVVPLWFMPEWLRGLAEWLPFSQAYYVPAAVLTGALEGAALWAAMGRQALWVGLLALIVHGLWSAAVRRVVVQGG